GADALIVKPGLPCLDVLRAVREDVLVPVGAYQVSGEHAMIKAAAMQGWLDEERAVSEATVCLARAGASFVITYFALGLAERMQQGRL
ncbi:MAG: porphobilinogen synthase, partial [Synergistaceae bacterium]|nr:porphobilinogen synthase [Synergistaceae bacterium]